MIDKRVTSLADALNGVRDGSVVLIGGFGAVGQPNALIEALLERRFRELDDFTYEAVPAVGGAMDLAAGAQRVWILMDHTSKDGASKLVQTCTLPLTAVRAVKRVYTNLAVIDVTERGFEVVGMIPGLSFESLQARTGAKLHGEPGRS